MYNLIRSRGGDLLGEPVRAGSFLILTIERTTLTALLGMYNEAVREVEKSYI